MSSESPLNNGPAEWVMPEPVFRTTEGRTPGPTKTPDDDVDTLETDVEAERPAGEGPAGAHLTTARPGEQAKKGGCTRSFLFILGIIVLLGTIVIGAVIYFLSNLLARTPNDF